MSECTFTPDPDLDDHVIQETRIADAVDRATHAVAPCWPLRDFVAVNPFLGLSHQSFPDVAKRMNKVAGASLFMSRSFFAEALADGRIQEADLEHAMQTEPEAARAVGSVEALRTAAFDRDPDVPSQPLPTVVDVATTVTGADWSELVTERISRWASTYFDEGQAAWANPWRQLQPYAAWRAESRYDRSAEFMGLNGFRAAVEFLPESPHEVIPLAISVLGISDADMELYFHRLLMTHAGWSAFARYHDWQKNLAGERGTTVAELLAIRLAWELIIWRCLDAPDLPDAWRAARNQLSQKPERPDGVPEFSVEILLQTAYEHASQERLLASISKRPQDRAAPRPEVQAAFCIDVRSERFRRALEACDESVETMGFAGFFGVPMAYVPLGSDEPQPQCPALLRPTLLVREGLADANAAELEAADQLQRTHNYAFRIWDRFKRDAVATFGFVETVGITYLYKLIAASLGADAVTPRKSTSTSGYKPNLEIAHKNGQRLGIDFETRVQLAANALKGMSLRDGFARIVLLAGHSSTSTNNPHAAGLECGACGGHSGESNARVLTMILNDPQVRSALVEEGIAIPDDTVFLPGNHNTTTDDVTLYDLEALPESHQADLRRLRNRLTTAARRTRRERAVDLGLSGETGIDELLRARGKDWSQVRPEWGLAGCTAFVAARRECTRGSSLKGQAFLHDYDWKVDTGFEVLESLMTAPLVVASWINMQYYASTVDNRVFGCGNKVLHNITGKLGVLEGNGGDLRVGLPWQSVHDGQRFVHDPVRLTAVIEAPVEAINGVIETHPDLKNLLDNGWLHLFALNTSGIVFQQYLGHGKWKSVTPDVLDRIAAA